MLYDVKKGILSFLKKRGYSLTKRQARNESEFNVLYYLAGFYLGKGYQGNLIQIGANDGVTNDPVRKIILDFKVPSLLVEPQPLIFNKLKETYADVQSVTLENCAIGSTDGLKELYYVEPNAPGYPAWATGIASFDKNILLKHRKALPGLDANLRRINVPVLSFQSLFRKHNIMNVLMLQLDTEGYDFELLKHIQSWINLPRIIHYEHKHLSLSDQKDCRSMLAKFGYSFSSTEQDTIAILEVDQ